jgi:hypothetical protein
VEHRDRRADARGRIASGGGRLGRHQPLSADWVLPAPVVLSGAGGRRVRARLAGILAARLNTILRSARANAPGHASGV